MNSYTEATHAAAASIMNAFSPLCERGESPQAAAVRLIRANRSNNSNAATLRQCCHFFSPWYRNFVGFTQPADQRAAMFKHYPQSHRAAAESSFSAVLDFSHIYSQFMGDALFIAYQRAVGGHVLYVINHSEGKGTHVYLEKQGDLFRVYFTTEAKLASYRVTLYLGEEFNAADKAFSDFTAALNRKED